jgi:hypothetical protein
MLIDGFEIKWASAAVNGLTSVRGTNLPGMPDEDMDEALRTLKSKHHLALAA